jgi:hypothetical protein
MKLGLRATAVIVNILELPHYLAVLGLPRHDSAETNQISSPNKEVKVFSAGWTMWRRRLLERFGVCQGDGVLCSGNDLGSYTLYCIPFGLICKDLMHCCALEGCCGSGCCGLGEVCCNGHCQGDVTCNSWRDTNGIRVESIIVRSSRCMGNQTLKVLDSLCVWVSPIIVRRKTSTHLVRDFDEIAHTDFYIGPTIWLWLVK